MLSALSIRNVVLIDSLDLDFGAGLAVLTGETGAGKSILLDALGLALGARADAGLVRVGCKQATVAAEFIGTEAIASRLEEIFDEQGLEASEILVLRRSLTAEGRSRAFINDQPVGAGILKRVGEVLVEIHGQFQTQGLMEPKTHRSLLDSFGRLRSDTERTAAAWRNWRSLLAERDRLYEEQSAAQAMQEELRSAIADIDALDPQPGEEAALTERRTFLMGAEQLSESLNAVAAEIEAADGALGSARRVIDKARATAGDRIGALAEALERAAIEISEAGSALAGLSTDLDADPGALEHTEERLFDLRDLARRHSVGVDELPQIRAALADRLSLIEDAGDRLTGLGRQCDLARRSYLEAAQKLSEERRKAAERLDAAVNAELPPLKLDKARFTTALETLEEANYGPDGRERIQFLIATNPGARPGPLNRVASGGELARLMLAIKVVLHSGEGAPVIVFDEVDAGIGGATADAVGERLARLGETAQVLVVTHSPQVAARGSGHLRVSKHSTDGVTTTSVDPLDSAARHEEIARMLAGATITDEARAAAAKLLDA